MLHIKKIAINQLNCLTINIEHSSSIDLVWIEKIHFYHDIFGDTTHENQTVVVHYPFTLKFSEILEQKRKQ